MGTNYYLEERAPCRECGREFERLHIGKSSAGWVFALHVYPDKDIHDLPDWVALWGHPGARIFDEYGKQVSPDELLLVIVGRVPAKPRGNQTAEWLSQNGAVPGPFGLARSKVSGMGCMAHGAGTYDLHDSDFS